MENIKQNKMGIMPVNSLLLKMALPMVISMLIQALYNVVDSYFVSMVSREALTAVSQSFSAQNLMIGIACGIAVGMNALISRSLGEGNREKANSIAANGLLLGIVGYAVMLIFGLFFTGVYFDGMLSSTPSDGGMLDLSLVRSEGMSYLSIVTVFSFGVFGQIIFERMMQATGRTIYTMYTQGIGAIVNIILDPIFILDKVPLLNIEGLGMGAAGAAIATVIGQVVAFALAFIFNAKKNPDISLKAKCFKPHLRYMGNIMAIGFPSIAMIAVGSVMYYVMNIIIMSVSDIGATVFGVYYKLQSFVFMPAFGFNNGMIPIIGYNYGAGNRKRITGTIKCALFYIVGIMTIGMLLMQIMPDVFIGLFEKDAEVIAIGCKAMRIISIHFPIAAVCIVLGSVFQALGYSMYSFVVSVARQMVVLLPAAYLLSLTGALSSIWFSFPIAEIMSLAVSLVLFRKIYKNVICKMESKSIEA